MDRLIGTSMGPYTITERIGEGGMAIVYKGYQESLHRYVALKVLREELARDQQFLARFRQEALAAANLNHPHILHVYDAGAANGKYFISMAYVDGGTLKDLIHQGLIDPARAVAITIQLAEALDHAHNQGLIHRDVKPSNVLMTRDGRPLLTDFGIAKALFEAQQLTRTGASIGTPEYMAPEQAKGQSPDGRTDIYALGVVLYEMLAARVPFCTDTPVATMYMHVHEPPPPLPVKEAAIPEWLENVVCKALAKDPADRYPTAALFAAALRQGQEGWAAAGRAAAGAAAAAAGATAATRTPTPPGIGVDEAPTAVEVFTTPGETEAATMVEPGTARTPAPAGATATPVPAKKRRKLLVPILIAAIALLVVATAATAAVLLSGDGKGTPGTTEPVVITVMASPTDDMGDAGGEAMPSAGPTEETPATSTVTSTATPTGTSTATPTATASGTTTSTPSPSATASRTPTATQAATSTPTTAPTEAPTNTPVPPPPTDTPVPPPPTDTPPPTKPPPTDTPPPTQPPPTPTSDEPPPP